MIGINKKIADYYKELGINSPLGRKKMTPANNLPMVINDKPINVTKIDGNDYLCLTDMAKSAGSDRALHSWLRAKNTIDSLGFWEQLNNPDFKVHEFVYFKNNAGDRESRKKLMQNTEAKMMREEKEIEITKEIAEEIMGGDNFIESAKLQANCHYCIKKCIMSNIPQKSIKMKEVSGYFLDNNDDIIVRGICDMCGGNCLSHIAIRSDTEKKKRANKYLNNAS